ncbi:hypothetical protein MSSAC_1868 [Methanosarcina siciliae C2J]|uniref:Nucleoside phosphorylase domain-containing protein n=1 Tax=Methanosarcina siciliae C2J TaxID=1434118 RepID=A0A0E3PM02_9EURY|nr:phosphorylase [Methanosarcina siciliae]AKB36458.1 hypothetical protein MSSAC_1868 [Methanosarcina siciliae C2J]
MSQAEIRNKCISVDPEERKIAISQLINDFEQLPNKKQAWEDLYLLTSDENSAVQWMAATALEIIFQHVPEKDLAWQDLIKLTIKEDKDIRIMAVTALGTVFRFVPDKEQAWRDLHKLTSNENGDIRYLLAEVVGSVFEQIPYKREAWEDLHRLTLDEDHRVRDETVLALRISFRFIPEKEEAWEDLVKLISDEESWVRWDSADALKTVLHYVPNKEKVLKDLRKLASDKDYLVKNEVILAQGTAFQYEPEKKKTWEEFCRLTSNENSNIRNAATKALGTSFLYVPDKKQAWKDLHSLTFDKNSDVRNGAAWALGTAFQHIPDIKQAWEDLHRLTLDEDSWVRNGSTWAIGSVFQYVPDKQNVCDDLYRLSSDEDNDVQIIACHFLGRVSVYRASQSSSEEEYMKELENSITFFEKSCEENSDNNPSGFCLPFYRSFYTIIQAEKQQTKDEVKKYFDEAKRAIRGSKNKKLLLEAVENLARALEEVQDQKNTKLEAKREKLDFYRKYCEKAAELMIDTEEVAPSATRVLKKGLPILDRKLKSLLEEIQEKAKTACRESKGTDTEEIAYAVSRKVQKWEIGSQEEMTSYVESFIFTLESKIPRLPENKHIFEMINESKNQKDLKKLFENTSELIDIIPEIIIDPERMKPTIGIITALPKEYAAVNILLENKNNKYKIPGYGAGRRYCLGEISSEEGKKHNLVLSTAGMGNNIAATRASLLLEHFPNVKSIIMVGIAGGVPNPDKIDDHIRLGDIVVSNENGVIQYDLIKQEIQDITHRNPPRPPSASLLEAVKYLEAEEILGNRPWEKYIDQALSIIKTIRPSEDKDVLYCSDSQGEIIKHPEDPKRIEGQPRVFTGPIASANILQKDPKARDKLRDKFGVKAIEMEASGIADATWNHEVGYLVVRGICDYCDSSKNDEWQQYAAVVAAAYTRALIESMP